MASIPVDGRLRAGGYINSNRVEVVSPGATSLIFQASKYGIVADGVTDDTAAWLKLIAALPADKALIRLHGPSVISAHGGLSYSLGFNVSDLAIIGDGHHCGFILAAGSNCNALRFNTDGNNRGPNRLSRVHLENFYIQHNGYQQAEPGAGIIGALVAWAVDDLTTKNVRLFNSRSTAVNIVGCRNLEIAGCLLDTVVPGGAANGINVIGTSLIGYQTGVANVHDNILRDVPGKATDIGGVNVARITQHDNIVTYRNLLPGPPATSSLSVLPFTPVNTSAAAWSNVTAYTVGNAVSYLASNYVALAASTGVTPGTNQAIWWKQTLPAAWSSSTSYVAGDCVTYTTASPGTAGASIGGGLTLQFTCRTANLNTPPVASGVLNSHWQIGGPLMAVSGCSGIASETIETNPSQDISIVGNAVAGQNAAGQYVCGNGVFVGDTSGSAGISASAITVTANSLRGCLISAISCNENASTITANVVNDCTGGILVGNTLGYNQSDHVVTANTITLGGAGNGTAINVLKTIANYTFNRIVLSDNVVNGGFAPMVVLTASLPNSPTTSLSVSPVPFAIPAGSILWIGGIIGPSGFTGNIAATVSTAVAAGATTIPVNSFTPPLTNTNTPVIQVIATLSGSLSSGVPITSLPVTALPAGIQAGTNLQIASNTSNKPLTATTAADALPGDTSIAITSVTPGNASYVAGQPLGNWGSGGIALSGGIQYFNVHHNNLDYLCGNALAVTASSSNPAHGNLDGNWINYANQPFNISTGLTDIGVRGGGWFSCNSGPSVPTTGVTYRDVTNQDPAPAIAQPGVPATGVATTSAVPYDCFVIITPGASTCTVALGAGTGATFTNVLTLASSGPPTTFIVKSGQQIKLTYTSAPTWAWSAL